MALNFHLIDFIPIFGFVGSNSVRIGFLMFWIYQTIFKKLLQLKEKSSRTLHSPRRRGAGSGGRTRTVSPPLDFESSTSANSIIPAGDGKDPHFSLVKKSTEGCLGSFFYYKKALRAWHKMELPAGIEPATCSLRVNRSTDWATVAS